MMLIGDYKGEVAIAFRKDCLEGFIEFLNRSHLLSSDGRFLLTFRVDEYEPGRAMLVETQMAVDA